MHVRKDHRRKLFCIPSWIFFRHFFWNGCVRGKSTSSQSVRLDCNTIVWFYSSNITPMILARTWVFQALVTLRFTSLVPLRVTSTLTYSWTRYFKMTGFLVSTTESQWLGTATLPTFLFAVCSSRVAATSSYSYPKMDLTSAVPDLVLSYS